MARGGKRDGAGRPKGVPNKNPPEIKTLAREYTAEAIEALARIMRSGDSEAARVSAANGLLDRGWGKPAQAITGEDGGPVRTVTRIENVVVDPANTDS